MKLIILHINIFSPFITKAGTQMKMGEFERLGEANQEVVLVAMNYRLGHLGFMCLPSDEAAGNMGLLDQVMWHSTPTWTNNY